MKTNLNKLTDRSVSRTEKPASRFNSARASRHHARRRLFLESLENRWLMAVVSHWTADNTAVDSVGTNNGTLVSGATYSAGQVGQAFKFDGVNDRVQAVDSASFKLTQSLTIEAWIRIDAFPSVDHGEILFRGDDRGGLDPYSLATEPNGSLRFLISSDINGGASVQAVAPLGQFVHVAATLDDATGAMKLYENGVLMSQITTTIRPFADLDPASNPGIGIGNDGGYPNTPHNFPFNGLIDEFIPGAPNRGLRDFLFRDNFVYVAMEVTDEIQRFDASTGIYVDTFVAAGSGGIDGPHGAEFGPDINGDGVGELFVSGRNSGTVHRYDGVTGQPLNALATTGSGVLVTPEGIEFDSSGLVYVSSTDNNKVKVFNAFTGAYVSSIGDANLVGPKDVKFGTGDGLVYTASSGNNRILRYNLNGIFVDDFVPAESGGISNPYRMDFGPDGDLLC